LNITLLYIYGVGSPPHHITKGVVATQSNGWNKTMCVLAAAVHGNWILAVAVHGNWIHWDSDELLVVQHVESHNKLSLSLEGQSGARLAFRPHDGNMMCVLAAAVRGNRMHWDNDELLMTRYIASQKKLSLSLGGQSSATLAF
jgi:hypothetical protein